LKGFASRKILKSGKAVNEYSRHERGGKKNYQGDILDLDFTGDKGRGQRASRSPGKKREKRYDTPIQDQESGGVNWNARLNPLVGPEHHDKGENRF